MKNLLLKFVYFSAAFCALLTFFAPAESAAQGHIKPQRAPMIIAPVIEGLHMCDEAANDMKLRTAYEVEAECRKKGINGSAALNRLLETLEPGGPNGQVQVGFTATLQLLGLYRRTTRGWEIDEIQLDNFLRVIQQVKRPVVIYLAADHFDSFGPLTQELQKNPKNLLQLKGAKPLNLNYFGFQVIPYTLQADSKIPVNRYRYAALEHVAGKLKALPPETQSRIIAITLMGELHHMFPDFENGMGAFQNIQSTDYSTASIEGFRSWLKKKFRTIGQFNKETLLDFSSFQSIDAPSKDIRKEKIAHLSEHYDAHAGGILTFAGWIWDPQNLVQRLDLLVNGKQIGPMERHLNRLDVYRAVESVTNPNVGFRFRYDYSSLSKGRYKAQVVATSSGKRYLVGEADFVVASSNPSEKFQNYPTSLESFSTAAENIPGIKAWMDLPSTGIDIYYNPLARLWDEYREWQVENLLSVFYNRALKAGLSASKLFSHQIMPNVNSSWNSNLLGTDQTLKGSMPWKQGINLYGGSTNSPWMQEYRTRERITDYGVPEFHPQQWKSADAHTAALQAQYDQGARFVSPYYFSIIPKRFANTFSINRLEISPDNTKEGSNQLHRALVEFAKK